MARKIAIASYSFRQWIKDSSKGFPAVVQFLEEHEIPFIELNNVFMKPSEFASIVSMFTEKNITPIQITVDGNNFFQKSLAKRQDQFQFMKQWIDVAHEASIPYVRANMGHGFGLFKKTDTIENLVATFSPILEYTEKLGMKFVFENHGGKSSDINFQLKVKEHFPSPNMGFLVDTGNYKPKNLIYDNILKLKDAILMVHAKTYDFDADGNETQLDFKQILANLDKIGYKGYYSIEYEGGLPAVEGVEKTIALLKKY